MRCRLINVAKEACTVLGAGLLYAAFIALSGWMIPCPVRLVTGLRCPGCGITHVFLGLLHLDFHAAWAANPFVFVLVPMGLLYYLYRSVRYIRTGSRSFTRQENVLLLAAAAAAVVFGILRNLPG